MTTYKGFFLILITPILLIFTHYLAVFPHEYAHSTMAWMLGYKADPLAIHYGGTSWPNLLLLLNIDEDVHYHMIFAQGQHIHVGMIALAGPGLANGVLYLLSLYWLRSAGVKERPFLFYFLFWFNFMNLGNFYDYVPIRTFSDLGDIAHIKMGFGLTSWQIAIVIGYLVAWIIWHFYTNTLIKAYYYLGLVSTMQRASLMITATMILFGYFGMAGFLGYGEQSHFISTISLVLIPGVIVACWPSRSWVIHRVQHFR